MWDNPHKILLSDVFCNILVTVLFSWWQNTVKDENGNYINKLRNTALERTKNYRTNKTETSDKISGSVIHVYHLVCKQLKQIKNIWKVFMIGTFANQYPI